MSTSRRNNRALNRVLRESLRSHQRSEAAPQEPDAPAYTLSTDIPESYNDSYVRAIPQDPQNTFVYWELPKGQAEGSLFADKGTAHVENNEAVRIGEQLSESQRRRLADSRRDEDNGHRQDNYGQANWDNGNQYGFAGGNQQYHHGIDNYHQVNIDNYRQVDWDSGNQYNFDGGNQQHHHGIDNYHQVNIDNYHQINWDNGNQYRIDDIYQHLRAADQYNWNDGEQYRRDEAYQHFHHLQDAVYRLNCNDGGGNYAAFRGDGNIAFSEMLSALIARCNQYIADYRQSGSGTLARALSSGLLCGISEEPRT